MAEVDAPVTATSAALAAISRLVTERGPVMFFQSGGCCDGSLPMCFAEGELLIGDHDVLSAEVGGCPFYIDPRQYEAWKPSAPHPRRERGRTRRLLARRR